MKGHTKPVIGKPATTLPVLIIGAGLAGLTLAQSLRKERVPFAVYERDASPAARGQGWSLGLSWIREPLAQGIITSDKPDLKSACADYALGLDKDGKGESESEGGESAVLLDGYTGEVALGGIKKFDDVQEYRVNRHRLRDWLSIGVEVNWGKRLVRFVEMEDWVEVMFEDGSRVKGCVLVGADGVHSLGTRWLRLHPPLG
jgi:flavin-dependent dehydrogenase